MRQPSRVCLGLLLSLVFLLGCANHATPTTTTVTTTTVECQVPGEGSDDHETPETEECTTISEETRVSHRPRECHGVVSCSFYIAGEAIALPFRALGAVLDFVF